MEIYSYNGHAKKDEAYRNDMTNFGILMEIRGIDKPFDWSREAVKKLQIDGKGTFYSPSIEYHLKHQKVNMLKRR